jgi:hypothetical protein
MRQKATSSTKAGKANKPIAQNLQAGISFWLLPTKAKDIVFRFIIECSNLRDFGPY